MCNCNRINKRIACVRCGYPPSEARYDLGADKDKDCSCTECVMDSDNELTELQSISYKRN